MSNHIYLLSNSRFPLRLVSNFSKLFIASFCLSSTALQAHVLIAQLQPIIHSLSTKDQVSYLSQKEALMNCLMVHSIANWALHRWWSTESSLSLYLCLWIECFLGSCHILQIRPLSLNLSLCKLGLSTSLSYYRVARYLYWAYLSLLPSSSSNQFAALFVSQN